MHGMADDDADGGDTLKRNRADEAQEHEEGGDGPDAKSARLDGDGSHRTGAFSRFSFRMLNLWTAVWRLELSATLSLMAGKDSGDHDAGSDFCVRGLAWATGSPSLSVSESSVLHFCHWKFVMIFISTTVDALVHLFWFAST